MGSEYLKNSFLYSWGKKRLKSGWLATLRRKKKRSFPIPLPAFLSEECFKSPPDRFSLLFQSKIQGRVEPVSALGSRWSYKITVRLHFPFFQEKQFQHIFPALERELGNFVNRAYFFHMASLCHYPSLDPLLRSKPRLKPLHLGRKNEKTHRKMRRVLFLPLDIPEAELQDRLPPPFRLPDGPRQLLFLVYHDCGRNQPVGFEKRLRFELLAPASLDRQVGYLTWFSSYVFLDRPSLPGDPFRAVYNIDPREFRFTLADRKKNILFRLLLHPTHPFGLGQELPPFLREPPMFFSQNKQDFNVSCRKERAEFALNHLHFLQNQTESENLSRIQDGRKAAPTMAQFLSHRLGVPISERSEAFFLPSLELCLLEVVP